MSKDSAFLKVSSRMMLQIRLAGVVLIGLWALAGCKQSNEGEVEPTPRFNVVLISIDSLRADHLGCYGYSRNTSPNLDRLAQEGCLFENTISTTSWTLPAHAALFTGLFDSAHGVCLDGFRLDQKRITLAEALQQKGWKTAGFYSGPYLEPAYGLSQGFARYESCMERNTAFDIHALQQVLKAHTDSHVQITSPRVTQAALAWLEEHSAEPFFLFLHYFDVHHDYIPPPPYDTLFDAHYQGSMTGKDFLRNRAIKPGMDPADLQHLIALYDGEIAFTDLHVGKVIDRLRKLEKLDETLVIITSDHGDEFLEHGDKGHRNGIYDEVIKVPFILRFPPKVPAGMRIPAQVRIIDILPSTLDILGVEPNKEAMGVSLLPYLRGEQMKEDLPALSELHSNLGDNLFSLRTRRFKVILNRSKKVGTVFDLEKDPGEMINLPPDHPLKKEAIPKYQREWQTLKKASRLLPRSSRPQKARVPAKTKKMLEDLGYYQK